MRFSFYTVDEAYCDSLRSTDPCVPYTMEKKSTRPFVGIVFNVNGFHYYAPLTSPKPKHLQMKNQIDFLKIKNGEWGAINFNNMIPVPQPCLKEVDMRISDRDSKQDIAYKELLSNQLSWCNAHKKTILNQAEKLYLTIAQGKAWDALANRCCNFQADERQCLLYVQKLTRTTGDTSVTLSEQPVKKPSVRQRLRDMAAERQRAEQQAHSAMRGLPEKDISRGGRDER